MSSSLLLLVLAFLALGTLGALVVLVVWLARRAATQSQSARPGHGGSPEV